MTTKAIAERPKAATVQFVGLDAKVYGKPVSHGQFAADMAAVRDELLMAKAAEGFAMYDGALHAVNGADISGFVVRQPKDEGQVTQGDYAKHLGKSAGYVSKLVRLGRAAVRYGVKPGSPEWTFLASENFTTDLSKILGESVKDWEADKSGSRRRFQSALKEARAAHAEGRKAKDTDRAEGESERTVQGEANVTQPEANRPSIQTGDGIPSTIADLGVLIQQVLTVSLSRLNDTDAKTARDMLSHIVKADAEARELMAAKAAKVTPKVMPQQRKAEQPVQGKDSTPES